MSPLLAQSGRPFPDWAWFSDDNIDRLRGLLVEHVQLTVLALLLGLLVAVPLAVAAVRWRRLYSPLLNITGVLFTIPSAALFIACFAFLPVATFGLKPTTSLLGLTIYTLLILFRRIKWL